MKKLFKTGLLILTLVVTTVSCTNVDTGHEAAQGNYDAGVLNAKTQDLLSQPKMLEKQRIDNERIMWEGYAKTGKSPFGENNIFGGANGNNPMLMLQR